tara:strand:+ start:133 stop:1128 length:996 start_codon:yes stop_codon:yes gene_type:complete
MRAIRPSALKKEIKANALADIPTMIWGGPGIGKSAIPAAIAASENAVFRDLRINLYDPVDIRGGLKLVEENGKWRTKYGVPEDYPDPEYQGTVYFMMDELTSAPKATMNACLQLTLDKRIGAYTLPKHTIIIAAGNRAKDRAAVHDMPTPLKNRFAHYELEANIDDVISYAMRANWDESIISFLRYRPALLHSVDANENAFPSPRTWEMLSKKLPFAVDDFYAAASLVGDGPAGEFVAFKSIYKDIPDIDGILNNPGQSKVPESTSVLYAICGALSSRATPENFNAIVKYINRMPAEYQVIVIRDSIAKDRSLITHEKFQKWSDDNADVLL